MFLNIFFVLFKEDIFSSVYRTSLKRASSEKPTGILLYLFLFLTAGVLGEVGSGGGGGGESPSPPGTGRTWTDGTGRTWAKNKFKLFVCPFRGLLSPWKGPHKPPRKGLNTTKNHACCNHSHHVRTLFSGSCRAGTTVDGRKHPPVKYVQKKQ